MGHQFQKFWYRIYLKDLAVRGFGDVETVTAMEEHLLFAVPPELRKDLKAAGSFNATFYAYLRMKAKCAAQADYCSRD